MRKIMYRKFTSNKEIHTPGKYCKVIVMVLFISKTILPFYINNICISLLIHGGPSTY